MHEASRPRDEFLSRVREGLHSDDWRVRDETVRAIHGYEGKEKNAVYEFLIHTLVNTGDTGCRTATMLAIVAFGPAMYTHLSKALRANSGVARRWIVQAMSGCADAASSELIPLVQETDASLRFAAMEALSAANSVPDEFFVACMRDGEPLMRMSALETLLKRRHLFSKAEWKALMSDSVLRYPALRCLEFAHEGDAARLWSLALDAESSSAWWTACAEVANRDLRLLRELRASPLQHDARVRELLRGQPLLDTTRSSSEQEIEQQNAALISEADDAFRNVLDAVANCAGIQLSESAFPMATRRISRRMHALAMTDANQYVAYLACADGLRDELPRLIECLVTQETYFFRELPQLRAFRDEVIPDCTSTGRTTTIWSAGCATGEEAYTLAILLREAGFSDDRVRVIGTDISREGLRVAAGAAYRPRSFRELPARYERWFSSPSHGLRVVDSRVQKMCTFVAHNLMSAAPPSTLCDVDVIFCRNVLIYFSLESRRRIVRMFFEALRDGGVLFLGHSESLLHISSDFELAHFRSDMAYRKTRQRAAGGQADWRIR